MLPNSYFDGSRLRAYLAMLEEFKETTVEQVFTNVQEKNVLVVGVRADSESDCEKAMLSVKVHCSYDEVEYDFSDVCVGSFVSTVLESKRHVNRHVRHWSSYLVQDVSSTVSVIVKNGQWSKMVKNVNKIFFCLTPKVVPTKFYLNLSDSIFNPINIQEYSRGKRKPWLNAVKPEIVQFLVLIGL
jgi:hypothetical protein